MARFVSSLKALQLDPEKVAYWYFRLNGYLQIENFVIHPERRGGQRTDADLLAVRFPHRAERLIDDPNDIMPDDEHRLSLSDDLIDVIIAEVKRNEPCKLNGPWVEEERQNIHRVLAAVGCLRPECIDVAAANLYESGAHQIDQDLRIRLVAVGRDRSEVLEGSYPDVIQLTWAEVLTFIWRRFHAYKNQKKDVSQWDTQGRKIKRLADQSRDAKEFVEKALCLMGVRNAN